VWVEISIIFTLMVFCSCSFTFSPVDCFPFPSLCWCKRNGCLDIKEKIIDTTIPYACALCSQRSGGTVKSPRRDETAKGSPFSFEKLQDDRHC